ncbi:MAG: hypothetical protein ABIP71_12695, partial [Verrucomicrobiota bacterium]
MKALRYRFFVSLTWRNSNNQAARNVASLSPVKPLSDNPGTSSGEIAQATIQANPKLFSFPLLRTKFLQI